MARIAVRPPRPSPSGSVSTCATLRRPSRLLLGRGRDFRRESVVNLDMPVLDAGTNGVRQIASIVLRNGLVARSAREANPGLRLLSELKLFGFHARRELDVGRGRFASLMPLRAPSHVSEATRLGGTLAGARRTPAKPYRYLVGSFHASTGPPFRSLHAPSFRLF